MRTGPVSPARWGEEAIEAVRGRLGIGWWRVGLRLYSREEASRTALAILEREMAAPKRMKIERMARRRGEAIEQSSETGMPSSAALQAINWPGGQVQAVLRASPALILGL